MKQKTKLLWLLLAAFVIFAILFCFFAKRIDFHDSPQYINTAKEFAGLSIAPVYTGHASTYPFFISLFLKFFPFYLTVKLVNISWLIMIGLVLYLITKDIKSFILWMFSPLVWYVSIIITPIVVVSFSLILAYFFLLKWEKNHKKIYFVLSGLSLGLSLLVWSGALVFVLFFLITFFFSKSLKKLVYYLIFVLQGVLFRFIFDTKVYGFPFYSYIRPYGSVMARRLDSIQGGTTDSFRGDLIIGVIAKLMIFICPLSFFIYKLDFKKYKREVLFSVLSLLFIFYYQVEFYPMLIAPFLIIFLSKVLSKKQVMISILLSIIIIPLLTSSYFIQSQENIRAEDLRDIYQEFGYEKVIAGNVHGSFSTASLNSAYWYDTKPKVLWASDYKMYLNNETYVNHYSISPNPKINTVRILEISAAVKRNICIDSEFEGLPLLAYENEDVPEGFQKIKCYRMVCVYEPKLL